MPTSFILTMSNMGIDITEQALLKHDDIRKRQRKEDKAMLMKWLKCFFLGHFKSDELRSDKSRPHGKRHYHYCKECNKRWYQD